MDHASLWLREGPSQGAWFLGHLWTLALEQQFYLFWPLLIVVAGWRRARWVALVVPLLMPLVRIGIYFLLPDQRGYLGMMLHTAIDSILVGCAVALFRDPIERWLQPRPWTLPVAIGFVFVLSPLLGTLVRPYRITVGFGLDALCCGVLILAAERSGVWSQWLGARLPVFLGTISYGLYIWQQLFLTPLNTTLSGRFPLSLLATLACATASYQLIEQPFLRLKVLFQRASL